MANVTPARIDLFKQAYLRNEKIRTLYAATSDPFPLPVSRRK